MNKTYCILLLILLTSFTGFAQKEGGSTKKLKEIWLSNESPGIKAMLVKGLNLKIEDLPLADAFAATIITFQAEQKKDADMRNLIQKFETMAPVTKKELDDQYPKIVSAYEKFAQSKNLQIYHFQAELNVGLTLKELDKRTDGKNPTEPDFYIDRMRFYTIAIQRELFESRNMVILPTYRKIMDLWASLAQTQKEALDQAGYPGYWKEQTNLYSHKFLNKSWACLCGTTQSVFPNLPDCGKKVVPINEAEKNLDEATLVLVLFNKGDLSIIKEVLRDPALATYTGSKDDIVRQLVFLHLSVINNWKMNSAMKIALVNLWDKAEANGSNDYVRRIGLTREALIELEAYYTCLLGIKSIATLEKESAEVAIDNAGIPIPIIKETIAETSKGTFQTKPKVSSIVRHGQPVTLTEMETIAAEVQTELQEHLDLHDALGGCVKAIPVDATTLEIQVTGCGISNKGLFKIMETDNPIAADFYDVCGNLTYIKVVEPFQKKFGGALQLTVIGTADTIPCVTCNNDTLAQRRANGVVAHLGPKLLAAATAGGREIKTEALTDEAERKAVIRIELLYPKDL